jgi:hypothetical protein
MKKYCITLIVMFGLFCFTLVLLTFSDARGDEIADRWDCISFCDEMERECKESCRGNETNSDYCIDYCTERRINCVLNCFELHKTFSGG